MAELIDWITVLVVLLIIGFLIYTKIRNQSMKDTYEEAKEMIRGET